MADAEAVIRELVARVAADRGLTAPLQITPINSGGANFTSALYLATVDHLKLFAKIAFVSDKMRAVMNAERLYKVEQIIYNELVNIYQEITNKREDVTPFRFPKVFATLEEVGKEAVVMEDLSAQGYKAPSRHDAIDWRFASAAITKLASFHALSFAYEKEKPEEFAALAERLKYEHPKRSPENEESIEVAMKKLVGGALQVVQDEHKAGLLKILQNVEGFTKFREPISRTVLVHGDYRASNLMVKELNGDLDIIVVDYQTVHSGCPAADLLYFLFLGTDQQFRRKHYQDVLQHYHQELGVALRGLGLDVESEYSQEVFENDVKEMIPLALQFSMVILPIVTVEESAAPTLSGDADLAQFVITPNQLFAERFRALVQDCANWGAL